MVVPHSELIERNDHRANRPHGAPARRGGHGNAASRPLPGAGLRGGTAGEVHEPEARLAQMRHLTARCLPVRDDQGSARLQPPRLQNRQAGRLPDQDQRPRQAARSDPVQPRRPGRRGPGHAAHDEGHDAREGPRAVRPHRVRPTRRRPEQPLTCGLTATEENIEHPYKRETFSRDVKWARSVAAKCRARNGDRLPYFTTRNTARDMDVLRAVLGERKISYLGYSYGTYLAPSTRRCSPGGPIASCWTARSTPPGSGAA